MKPFLMASLISLLPIALTAQQASINTSGETAASTVATDNPSSLRYSVKTVKELRKAAREKRSFDKTLDAFAHDFKNATHVQWSSGKRVFTALFVHNDVKTIAWYSKSGMLLYTLLSYNADKLAPTEREQLQKEFCGFTITHVNEIHDAGTKVYLVHLENDTSIKLVTLHDGVTSLYRAYKKS